MRDDAELLRAYVGDRSETAFTELVQRHIDLVYAAALRRLGGDSHGANDVTQEVFTRLARKAAALINHPSLAGWLHTCTRYAAADVARQKQRRRARELAASVPEAVGAPADSPVDWAQLRPLIDHALDQLGSDDREAILLRFFSGQPWAQVGARLRVSEDAARKRVEYALERLRVQLARRGVTSSAAVLALGLANVPVTAAPAGLAGSVASGALAAAAPAGAASAAVSILMTSVKSTAGLGVWAMATATMIGTASLATLAWREHRALDGLRAELAAAHGDAGRQLAPLNARLAEARQERDAQHRRAAEAPPAPPPAPPPSYSRVQAALTEALNAIPEYTELTRRGYRLEVQKEFGEFLAGQTLSAAQREGLKELLVRRRELQAQRSLELQKNGPPPGARWLTIGDSGSYGVVVTPSPDSPEEALRRDMKALLGDTMYSKFEHYDQLRMYALPAERIAADLREQNAALSDSQRAGLQRLLHETRTYPGSGSGGLSTDPAPNTQEATLRDRAHAFLSPQQVRLLTDYVIDQRVATSHRQRLTSTIFPGRRAAPAPAPSR